jgi:K+ transporter
MRANVEYNHMLPEHVVTMSIETLPVPRVPDSERIEVDELGCANAGIIHITAHFGYMEAPDVLGALQLLDPAQTKGPIPIDDGFAAVIGVNVLVIVKIRARSRLRRGDSRLGTKGLLQTLTT